MPDYLFQLDLIFKALSDYNRRHILHLLSRSPASVSYLLGPLPMSLQAASQHLEVLEKAGLVTSEKRGRVRTCRIDVETLKLADEWISARLRTAARQPTFSRTFSRCRR